MPDSPETFDPYWEWLEIPPEDQPPSYYRLLGIDEFEQDLAAIDAAAKQRTAYLHPMGAGPSRESVQRLLSEVAKARRTLLAADAKSAYDESLRVPPVRSTPPPLLQSPPLETAVSDAVTLQNETLATDADDEAAEKPSPETIRRRKKSLLNDWRVHVVSALILLAGAVGFVLYKNTRPSKVASVAAPLSKPRTSASARRVAPSEVSAIGARSDSSSSSASMERSKTQRDKNSKAQSRILGSNSRPKTPLRGQSGLGRMLAESGFSMDQVEGPKDAMPPGGKTTETGNAGGGGTSSAKASKGGSLPTTAEIELPDDWLNGLNPPNDFEKPLIETFDVSKLRGVLKPEDGKLVMQPVDPKSAAGKLTLKNPKLGLGETVVLKTNLSLKSPMDNRLGLAVGQVRISLCPKEEVVEVRINGKRAAKFSPVSGEEIVLAVTRDGKDAKKFHWITQSGAETRSGRVEFRADLPASVPMGVLAKSSDKNPEPAIEITEFSYGKLTKQPELVKTKYLPVDPPEK